MTTLAKSERLILLATFALVLLLAPSPASAQFMDDGLFLLETVYDYARQGIYFLGGIGLIVIAIFAFFGRFKWTHFFALAGGIFIVAMTDQLIQFLSSGTL